MMTRLSMILANCGKKLLHADMQIYFKNRQSHSDTSIICILGKFLLKLHSRLVQGDSQIWWDLGVQIHTVANFYPCSPTISFFTWNSHCISPLFLCGLREKTRPLSFSSIWTTKTQHQLKKITLQEINWALS